MTFDEMSVSPSPALKYILSGLAVHFAVNVTVPSSALKFLNVLFLFPLMEVIPVGLPFCVIAWSES